LIGLIIPPFSEIKKAQFFGLGIDSFFTLKIQSDENQGKKISYKFLIARG